MTKGELSSAMRYFSALFTKWPQASSEEVVVAYGARVEDANIFDVKVAIEELAEGSLLFPSVQEFIEAVAIVRRRNREDQPKPKLAAPKIPPLQLFVQSMREAGENRKIGPNEIRAYRIVAQSGAPTGARIRDFMREGITAPLTDESYSSVSEFLAHEGYAVR
jgi:hypothetical protein